MFKSKEKYVLVLFVALFSISYDAHAQTARNLKCNGCVGTRDLADGAITSKKIQNRQVKPADLSNKAKPSGAAFSEINSYVSLEEDPIVLRKIAINAPANGIVIANASGNPYFNDADPKTIFCTISLDPGSPIDWKTEITTSQTGSTVQNRDTPISLVRAFKINKGQIKIYFLCRETSSDAGVDFYDPVLVGFFVPGVFGTTVSKFPDVKLQGSKSTTQK